ncbi:hypothetical protein EV426DRAFT_418222 [Tirmania nivea]|nr:hypothetical protein EV426DRAFT_418222 [Tirmania nivea]
MAQVKLSFKSTDGAKVVCTRSLQVTMKANSRSQKTLEGQLLVVKNGERTTLSSKVADLNGVMLQYLGVSKAILEYVIFCHQDESLWPMSEPATLKKKFDDIFEAVKYTNAIKNIKDLVKKQKEDLGQEKVRLEQYRIDKDRAERAEKKSRDLHAEVESQRDKITALDAEIKASTKETQEYWKTASEFEAMIAALNGKRQQMVTMKENIEDLAKGLELVEDSDEELENMKRDYDTRMRVFEDSIKTLEAQQGQLHVELQRVRRALEVKLTEQGTATAEKKAFERQVARRSELIKETSRRHNIRGFDLDLDDALIQEFMQRLSRMYKDQAAALERVKRETREELAVAQEDLNKINTQRSSLLQRKDYARTEIRSLEPKATNLQRRLDEVNVDEGQETMAQNELDQNAERLKQAKNDFDKTEYDQKMRRLSSEIREVEQQIQDVTTELSKTTKQADDRATLGLLKKELDTRIKALEALSSSNQGKFNQIMGDAWSGGNPERELQNIVE